MLIDFVQGVRSNYHIALYFWRMYDIYNRLKNDQKLPKSQVQKPRGQDNPWGKSTASKSTSEW